MEKILKMRDCSTCKQSFPITDRDLAFYKKMRVPLPQLCPDCRQQRRLAMRNERQLYERNCSMCQKHIISIYSEDKPDTVYCADCYYSDDWDPIQYGRDFNFEKPFFPQLYALWKEIPKVALVVLGDNINSDYTNDNYKLQNCYLTYDGEQAQDCYYGETFSHAKDCLDFLSIQEMELCYECINCVNGYDLKFSRFCHNCSESWFLIDCTGCKNCFGCANLHQKQYHIFNKPYSKEEYEAKIKSFNLSNFDSLQKYKEESETFFRQQIKKEFRGMMNENVNGDNLVECKDTFESFDCHRLRDCKYCTNIIMGATDCWDLNVWGENTSLVYNSVGAGAGAQNILCSYYIGINAVDISYSLFCWKGVSNLFGCAALSKKEYCILNKKYPPSEYKDLKEKIINHMKETGEWGEFFPEYMSPFGYNETVAQEFFPLTKEQAIEQEFHWSAYQRPKPKVEKIIPAAQLPEDIKDIPDDILNWAIECEITNKPFRIINQELDFYRKQGIPLPRKHPDQRHTDRQQLRNPRRLHERKCQKCETDIKTPYSPKKPETVYCEACYQQEVF